MAWKRLEDDVGSHSRVDNLFISLISTPIIGAAFIAIIFAGGVTALRKITSKQEEGVCGKKRTYSCAYGESVLLRNSITRKVGTSEI